jgi:hypothetical protein
MRQQFIAAVALCLLTAQVAAQEVLIECRFDFTPQKPAEAAKSKEKEAMAWFNDLDFTRRTFIFDLGNNAILDGPGRADMWKSPQVKVTSQEIEVEWDLHATPLDRSPRLWMKVNRFSGTAVEGYSMLQAPNRGPRMVYWGRPGKCSFSKRQI